MSVGREKKKRDGEKVRIEMGREARENGERKKKELKNVLKRKKKTGRDRERGRKEQKDN